MTQPLRIAVADDEPDMREFFVDVLQRLGYVVVSVASDGRQLVEQCALHHPDLAIVDIKMPVLDGLGAAREIYQQRPIPVVVVSAHHDCQILEEAAESHVFAYLVKPIRESHLGPTISLVMRRFNDFEAIRQEAQDLRQALNDRKLIERAKGVLMKQANLDEPAAFRRLQRLASSHNRKLVDTAEMVLVAAEALRPLANRSEE